jgi:hypothetical protein
MLSDLHAFTSKDSNYVALQGHENRITINVRVDCRAIADLPGIGITPTYEQCLAFVRYNIEAIREIAESKLEDGEGQPEDRAGKLGVAIHIRDVDFAEYLSIPGNRLSLAAFDPYIQTSWLGGDGRFGAVRIDWR